MKITSTMTFGEFFKELRIQEGISLRRFCVENGFDPGNISKLERGRTAPPKSNDVLKGYAEALSLAEGTPDWENFFDLAAAYAGVVPTDIMTDDELVSKLPLVFRTIRGQRIDTAKLRELAELIRES